MLLHVAPDGAAIEQDEAGTDQQRQEARKQERKDERAKREGARHPVLSARAHVRTADADPLPFAPPEPSRYCQMAGHDADIV